MFPCIPVPCHLCSCCSQGNAVFYALIMLQVWDFSSDFQSAWELQDPAVILPSSSSFPACSWPGSTNQMFSVLLTCCGLFGSSSLATAHRLDWNILHLASSYFSPKTTYHWPTRGLWQASGVSVRSWEALGKVCKHYVLISNRQSLHIIYITRVYLSVFIGQKLILQGQRISCIYNA